MSERCDIAMAVLVTVIAWWLVRDVLRRKREMEFADSVERWVMEYEPS